jgi:hypothetical protein
MRTLTLFIFSLLALTNLLKANPVLVDSCVTIVWKSGKSMSIRLIEKTDRYIRYSKCNDPNVVFKANLSEVSELETLNLPQKSEVVQASGCEQLVFLSGATEEVKILQKTDKFITYHRCKDETKTEFTIPISEVKEINGKPETLLTPKQLLQVSDSCQTITWVGGKTMAVVVVSQNNTHFQYYKCSDKKKRVYTANNLELLSQADRPEARKSGILSTLSLAFSCVGILLWPLGVAGFTLGLISLVRKKPGKKRAIWGLIIGGIITLIFSAYVLAFLLIILI